MALRFKDVQVGQSFEFDSICQHNFGILGVRFKKISPRKYESDDGSTRIDYTIDSINTPVLAIGPGRISQDSAFFLLEVAKKAREALKQEYDESEHGSWSHVIKGLDSAIKSADPTWPHSLIKEQSSSS